MERGKRLLVLLLSVLMVVSQMSVSAFAFAPEGESPAGGETPIVGEEPKEGEQHNEPEGEVQQPAQGQEGTQSPLTLQEVPSQGETGNDEGPAVVEKHKFTIVNNTGDSIMIVGKNNGMDYSHELSDVNKEYNLDSLDGIYAKRVMTLEGTVPTYSVSTHDGTYAYHMNFNEAVKTDIKLIVKVDNEHALVRFEPNGGSGSMEPQIFKLNRSQALETSTFSKSGCYFLGWSKTAGGSKDYNDGEEIAITKGMTLHAVWHTHVWKAEKEAGVSNIATVRCNSANCPYKATTVKLEATTPAVYDGTPYDGIKVTAKGLPEVLKLSAVEYYQDGVEDALSGPPTDVGTYTAKVSVKNGNTVVTELQTVFEITKRQLNVRAEDKVKELNAADPDLTFTIEGLADGDTADKVMSGELKRDSGEAAGAYFIRQGTLAANDNYSVSFTNGKLTISKGIPTVTTEPSAVSGIVYDGYSHELITSGAAEHGTILYYKGSDPYDESAQWIDTVPSGTSAKSFDVYYKVKGDTNYSDLPPKKIEGVSIAPQTVEVEWTNTKLVYNGNPKAPTAAVKGHEELVPVVSGEQTDANVGKVGADYVATASLSNSNYELTNTECSFYIYPRTATITWSGDSSITYDGSDHTPIVSEVQNRWCGVKSIELSKAEGTESQSAEKAVDVGHYTAVASPDNPNFSFENLYEQEVQGAPKNIQEKTFDITPATFKPGLSLESWTYGEKPKAPVLTNNVSGGDVTYEYCAEGSTEYKSEVPTQAGTHTVRATIAAKGNYQSARQWAAFTINVADPDASVSIESWTYGEEAKAPVVKGNIGNADVNFWYKGTQNDGTNYSAEEVPTQAGSYVVEARVHQTPNTSEKKCTPAQFTINRATPSVTVSLNDWVYGDYDAEKNPVNIEAPAEVKNSAVVKYSESKTGERKDVNESVLAALNAGNYYLWAENKDTYNYTSASASTTFTVGKAELDIEVGPAPNLVYEFNEAEGKPVAKVLVSLSGKDVVDGHVPAGVTVRYKTSRRGSYSTDVPTGTLAGGYNIWYKIDGGRNYKDVDPFIHILPDFTARISQADIHVSESQITEDGWTYGSDPVDPVIAEGAVPSDYNGDISFEYCEASLADDPDKEAVYTDTVPVDAGKYYVRAVFEETRNYNEVRSEAVKFEISKATPPLTVSLDSWTYGEDAKTPVVEGNLGEGALSYWYYGKNAAGESYHGNGSTTPPSEAGSYHLIVQVAETSNTTEATATTDFDINKADPFNGLTIKDWMYNGFDPAVNAPVLKDLPDEIKTYKFRYTNLNGKSIDKLVPADFSDWFTPAKFNEEMAKLDVGEYAVEAYIQGTNNYKSVVTDPEPFKVSKGSPNYDPAKLPAGATGLTYSGEAQKLFANFDIDYWVKATGGNTLLWAVSEEEGKKPSTSSYTKILTGNDIPWGTEAGTYYIWLRVENPNTVSDDIDDPLEVEIGKKDPSLTLSINGWTYGQPANAPVLEGNIEEGAVTYTYEGETNAHAHYSGKDAPSEAGSYTVKATVAETDNYNGATTDPVSFTVGRAALNLTAEASDWTYGSDPVLPEVQGNLGDGELTYWYWQDGHDGSHDTPENAGDYHVEVTAAETANYASGSASDVFKIEKAYLSASVYVYDWAYGEFDPEENLPIVSGLPEEIGTDEIKYNYAAMNGDIAKVEDKDFSGWLPLSEIQKAFATLEKGDYVIKAKIPGNANYYGIDETDLAVFEVTVGKADYNKAMLPTAAKNLKYNKTDQNLIVLTQDQLDYWTSEANNNDLYWAVREKGSSLFPPLRPNPSAFTKVVSADTLPTGKGIDTYYVWLRVENDNTHSSNVGPLVVKIDKGVLTGLAVAIDSWTYREAAKTPVVSNNVSHGAEHFRYTGRTDAGDPYSSVSAPTQAGSYKVTVTVAATGHYNSGSAEADFRINKAAGPAPSKDPVAKTGLVYTGQAQTLIKAGDAVGRGVMMYKLSTDAEYSTQIPKATEAGEYTVQYYVDYPGTSNYADTEPVTMDPITIERADSDYVAPVANTLTYNGSAQKLVTAGSSDYGYFEYKLAEETEEMYGRDVPEATAAGSYVVDYRFVADKDHKDASGSINVTIAKKTITVTAAPSSFTYDGKVQQPEITVEGAPESDYTIDIPASVNAGQYTAKVTAKDSVKDNYDVVGGEINYSIAKKTMTVSAAPKSFTYNGSKQQPEVTVTGWISDKDYVVSDPNSVNAGDYTVNVTAADAVKDNYTVKNGEVKYTIHRATMTVSASPKSFTYDGKVQRPEVTVKGAVSGSDYTYSRPQSKDAGTYKFAVTATEAVKGNYNVVGGDITYTIGKKDAKIVWKGDSSFKYDGNPHSVADNAKSIDGKVEGDDVDINLSGDVQKIEAGKYIAKAGLIGSAAGNYKLVSGTSYSWEIVRVAPQVDPADVAFNGTYAGDVPSAKSVKAKAAKKSFTVKWKKLKKKQLRSFTNVEVQYCSDGAFNRSTTAVRVVGKGKKSVKVKGLAKGSVYYVRVRNIRNAGGTKYASAWSGVKRVKVK